MIPTGFCRLLAAAVLTTAIAVGAVAEARDPVRIRLGGRYYAEPATVHIAVVVEPNDENRVLRIEADGDSFFRSADLPLEGANAPKNHMVSFKNVPAGQYVVRARVLSQANELAQAKTALTVMSAR